jgi:hypothetical protein
MGRSIFLSILQQLGAVDVTGPRTTVLEHVKTGGGMVETEAVIG